MITVYIKTNTDGCIVSIDSSIFVADTTGWTAIDEGEGDRYAHAQNGYLDKPITDEYGCYNYKYENDTVIERTQDEKDAEMFPQYVQAKISEMDKICTQTIYDGIDIELSIGVEHFTLDEHDQANLLGLGLELGQGAEMVTWHNDDKNESCKFYSAADATKIIQSLTVWKALQITFYRDLRIYINSLTTKAEVDAITYDTKLPDEFKSDVLKYYEKIVYGE